MENFTPIEHPNLSDEVENFRETVYGERDGSFTEFLQSFAQLKIEKEAVEKTDDELSGHGSSPLQQIYQKQLQEAISKMGLTMDDYFNVRSKWSENVASEQFNDANEDFITDEELHALGLNTEEIKEVNDMASLEMERKYTKIAPSKGDDKMEQSLGMNLSGLMNEKQDKLNVLIEEIRKETEYIVQAPKWLTGVQKDLVT